MTLLIIGLIAAVGVGGVALSGGGGGGGGTPAPAYEEVIPNQPSSRPDILSILATADRYPHAQTVMTNDVWENYISVQAGNGNMQITSDAPQVVNGKFVYSVSDGELEDVWQPYLVNMTLDNYQKSDAYADYYSKNGGIFIGLYNNKIFASEPDNWVQENVTLTENLVLGGNVLGLKNSDFGFHRQDTNTMLFGSGASQVNSFYMYDNTTLASAVRSDTATFSGNLLGGIQAITYEGEGNYIPYNLTGTATATLNFDTNNLMATLDTKLNNKTYHSFNLIGHINSPSAFSISGMSIDTGKNIDNSLNAYKLSSVYGTGNGKILSDEEQTELVGQLDFYATVESGIYEDITGNLSFGMIEGREPTTGNTDQPPVEEPTVNSISVLATPQHFNTALTIRTLEFSISPSIMADIASYPPIAVGDEMLSITSPKLNVSSNIWSYAHQAYNINMTLDDYQNSDSYADYYLKQDTSLSGSDNIRDALALGGKIVGLKNSDFGYHHQEIFLTWNIPSWHSSSFGSVFYMYDIDRLSTLVRSDEAAFNGNLVGTIRYAYDNVRSREAFLTGTVAASVNFATATLSVSLDTQYKDYSHNMDYYAFQATGQLNSPSAFSISAVVPDANKSIDETSLVKGFRLDSVSGSGNGVFLSDISQNEMVGKIELLGSSTIENINNDVHQATVYGSLSFGATEMP